MIASAGPIRAVVIADVSSQRTRLVEVLQRDGDITVEGVETVAEAAVDLVARLRPDAIVLDIQLGAACSTRIIEQLMAHTPTPILVLTAGVDDRHSARAVEALLCGALDALPAPVRWTAELGAQLRATVRQISKVQVIRHPRQPRRHRASNAARNAG